MKLKAYIITSLLVLSVLSVSAQHNMEETTEKKTKRAWEVGLGGSVFQFSRVGFSNFTKYDGGYDFDLTLDHAVWGGDIYVARELNRHFYLDFQGNLGFTNNAIEGKHRWMGMAGLGLQWRLGEYFGSKYIDPYLRAGMNYMYKNFSIMYTGTEGLDPDAMQWVQKNFNNKNGADRKHLAPIALGGGVNMWLNDRFGIGLQADYLIMPVKNVANSLQCTARLIWRIGGKSKKATPSVQYVERIVERPVETVKEVIVEKIIEKDNDVDVLMGLFNQLYFEFDSYALTSESENILDEIAEILLRNTDKKFLMTGQTDSRGSETYNIKLSENRAATVMKGLVNRDVPAGIMKSRGIGKRIAAVEYNAANNVREGDRKVTIELVTNMDYWNYLK